jgi:hypothetical protein
MTGALPFSARVVSLILRCRYQETRLVRLHRCLRRREAGPAIRGNAVATWITGAYDPTCKGGVHLVRIHVHAHGAKRLR